MSKQKKRSKLLKGILAAALAILALEALLVAWFEKRPEEVPPVTDNIAETTLSTDNIAETTLPPENTETIPETQTEVPESTPAATAPGEAAEILECVDDQIQTPYFSLYYPEALADLLVVMKTADEPFTLEFYAMLEGKPEQRIFDVRLSEQVRGNLGVVKTQTADVYVDMTFYRFTPDDSWTEGEINTVLAMQEAANDMISRLGLDESSGNGEAPEMEETAPESSVVNMLSIRTPYCVLYYPARWEDCLITEQTANEETGVYTVRFYAEAAGEKCLLFSILFGGDEGEQLGVVPVNGGGYIPVYVLLAELKPDGWHDEDVQLLYAMQEAVNELIGQLPLE